MRKFSYKDFCDNITANIPPSYHITSQIVNRVWKEMVKYILIELQRNREVYLPYIGYIYIDEKKNVEVPNYRGNNTRKVRKIDWVEFKPFKIFLDGINVLDTNDEKKLNKYLHKNRITEDEFIKQDFEEYVEKFVEPYYNDKELATVKEIVKGHKMEDDILAKIASDSYKRPYTVLGQRNSVYVKYKDSDNHERIENMNVAVKKLGLSKYKCYDFYWKNFKKCWEEDLLIDFLDIPTEVWLVGNYEQAKKKGWFYKNQYGGKHG